jgi:DNA repair photolyase
MLHKAEGNMYEWVTHTWSILNGACSHDCSYCYVKRSTVMRNPKLRAIYEGEPRYNEKDAGLNLGRDKKIFVAHTGDLFADRVPHEVIQRVLAQCNSYPFNNYVFQSKNPGRMVEYMSYYPRFVELGTTIESDDDELVAKYSKAPAPSRRLDYIADLRKSGFDTFITVEPVLKFSNDFARKIAEANPSFVNIGADSKKSDLVEPSKEEMEAFINELKEKGVHIRLKTNLERIMA